MRPHLSIFVSDLEKTVDFYTKVFEVKPQKRSKNYAKFDLKEPAFNFTMMTSTDGKVSNVSHLGVEVDSEEEVMSWKKRLTETGVLTRDEIGTNCCYAYQDKIWFSDPDGNEWEVFYVKEQPKVDNKDPGSDFKKGCCVP